MGCRVTHRLDEALEGADVAMALRLQLERQGAGLFPTLREYHARFGLRAEHLDRYPDLRILHPGPINRGVEVSSEVADAPERRSSSNRSPTASPCAWPCCTGWPGGSASEA